MRTHMGLDGCGAVGRDRMGLRRRVGEGLECPLR